MSLIFWDTNLFVYLMEEHPQFGVKVSRIRTDMLKRGDQLCTSALTLGEVLAGPCRRNDEELASRYKMALQSPHCELLSFTRKTADHYARIRARTGVRPADAVQLACAAQARVDLFLTNDERLRGLTVPGIQFIAGLDINVL
ncbi:MAG: PIN domain-containing protein [Acidobacteria bacterium]|nr:PIN domain-containing protein [Acidobacteriota bacterium]